MATLKALQKCSITRKYAVFGFIREVTKAQSLQHIPDLIRYICLAYYTPYGDFFDKWDDIKMKVSVSQCIATLSNHGSYLPVTLYGHQWIKSLSNNKHEWIFELDEVHGNISIGISADDNEFDKSVGSNGGSYAICNNTAGDFIFISVMSNYSAREIPRGLPSQITMTLLNGKLSFTINKRNYHAFSVKIGKNIKYKMAVTLRSEGDSITLKKYIKT